MFLERDLDIGGVGRLSHFKEKDFLRMKKNPEFFNSLEEYIKNPTFGNYLNLENKGWHAYYKEKPCYQDFPRIRFHRFALAFNENLCPISSDKELNSLYCSLKKYYPEFQPEKEKGHWFEKNELIVHFLKEKFPEENILNINGFTWGLKKELEDPSINILLEKKQVIYYGAPGTGKTYQAREIVKKIFDSWKIYLEEGEQKNYLFNSHYDFVQFHSSYGYEDFIEGMRPYIDREEKTSFLQLTNGIFKNICQKASLWERDIFYLIKELEKEDPHKNQEKIETLNDFNSLSLRYIFNTYQEKLTGKHWKYLFQEKKIQLTDDLLLIDLLPPYFLIVDEINRGELSRVFGELMLSLEYRGIKGKIKTQYSSINTEETSLLWYEGESFFFIPSNVYLIGTMNTIDRSVESIDMALRRRFYWEHISVFTQDKWKEYIENTLIQDKETIDLLEKEIINPLEKLNTKIQEQFGEDYQIGHAYLMAPLEKLENINKTSLQNLREKVWENSLLPLIQEYSRGSSLASEEAKIKDDCKKEFIGNKE